MTEGRGPLRGRYLAQHQGLVLWLRLNDALLELTSSPRVEPERAAPRRLLLAVGGHLGDAIISTTALGEIRATWPDVQIGVLTGSWNAPIFSNHPDVRWVHFVDHWKLSRSDDGWIKRAFVTGTSSRNALGEIRRTGYDTAIDLYPYFPNSARLLERARVPRRIGWSSGGGARRFTRALDWTPGAHVAGDHARLIGELTSHRGNAQTTYRLRPLSEDVKTAAARKLRDALDDDGTNFVVLHSGAGNPKKAWQPAHWAQVARALRARGFGVVLTGMGPSDARRALELQQAVPGIANLCDALDFDELRYVVSVARATISVDTVTAHLSAAHGTPTVVIMTGIDDPERWRPLGDDVVVLTERVPCFPCYRSSGCAAMSCIHGVAPETALAALAALAGSLRRVNTRAIGE
jgi:ADP-heptose:LPS heptosyltransferase